jgi:hypothetical protein
MPVDSHLSWLAILIRPRRRKNRRIHPAVLGASGVHLQYRQSKSIFGSALTDPDRSDDGGPRRFSRLCWSAQLWPLPSHPAGLRLEK